MYKINLQKLNNNIISSTSSKKKFKKYKLLTIDQHPFLPNLTKNLVVKVFIKTTLNNMFITYNFNNQIKTKSLASIGFKGKSKQTSYAYKTFAELITTDLLKIEVSPLIVDLYVKSLNYKLKTFLNIFKLHNITINKLYDITPLPYNGCRRKKISIKKKKKSIIKFLSYR